MKAIVIFLTLLQGCGFTADTFQSHSCMVVYCESSENSKVKAAGLKLIDIASQTQGVDLELDRGFCEEYYTRREFDYRYARKSAYDVCKGD